jgi:hypothetical protein
MKRTGQDYTGSTEAEGDKLTLDIPTYHDSKMGLPAGRR